MEDNSLQKASELHRSAMEFAERALFARRQHDSLLASRMFRKAFENESEAAQLLSVRVDLEPTRSVIHRSAASLGLECGQFEEALRLVRVGLRGNPPIEIASELRELEQQCKRISMAETALKTSPIPERFSGSGYPRVADRTQLGTWAEIANVIAEHRAVAFVGAGVSATVGLNTWHGLLMDQLEAAKRDFPDTEDLRKITEILESGDLTLGASILKRLRGRQFERDLGAVLGESQAPGPAHLALARIPFSHVVTTNYDPLLEWAYNPSITDTITYGQPDAMLDRIRRDQFALIKLHGHIANMYDAILTDDDFRSIQRSRPLVQCLRILFLVKHVVFIGHSLRDPDLLSLLTDLKQQFPKSGPHYAIFDDNAESTKNAASTFLGYLKESLNVHAVVYQYRGANREIELVRHLTSLHGEVCRRQSITRPLQGENLDEGLERRLERLLETACKITGSFRGDLAFFNDRKYSGWAITQARLRAERFRLADARVKGDGLSNNETRKETAAELARIEQQTTVPASGLYVEYCYGPTDRDITNEATIGQGSRRLTKPALSYPQSVIWTSFNWSRGPKLLHDANDPKEKKAEDIENYRASDTRVVSELAVPIHVGDARVGVLNLESNIESAYTEQHQEVAITLTREIGLVWDRIVRSEIYRDVTLDPNTMRQDPPSLSASVKTQSVGDGKSALTNVLEELLPFNIGFSLFVADHGRGRLVRRFASRHDMPTGSDLGGPFPDYSFTDTSFASMVFRKHRPLYLHDRNHKPSWVQVNNDIASRSHIGKELVGVPLFSRGLRIGVLTAWPQHTGGTPIGPDGAELIIRTAQLFARTDYLRQITQFQHQHDTTYEQCKFFRKLLDSFTMPIIRSNKQASDCADTNVIELLTCIRKMVAICSVRLFWTNEPFPLPMDKGSIIDFHCLGSIWGGRDELNGDRNSLIAKKSTERVGHLKNNPNSTENPYVDYVVRRSNWSPSAMLLYPGLLHTSGVPHAAEASIQSAPLYDPAAKLFDRDPNVGWYVAPITRCNSLVPAADEREWVREKRHLHGFIAVDNTIDLDADSENNELPASRTWHELARLKLTWCAAMIGHRCGVLAK